MKIEMMIIGALLFSLIFVTGFSIYISTLNTYNVQVDTSTTWGKISNNALALQKEGANMRSKIQGGDVTEGDATEDMVADSYTAIKESPYSALGIAANATETLLKEQHMVNSTTISIIMIILGILVTFAIIAVVFRFEQR